MPTDSATVVVVVVVVLVVVAYIVVKPSKSPAHEKDQKKEKERTILDRRTSKKEKNVQKGKSHIWLACVDQQRKKDQ